MSVAVAWGVAVDLTIVFGAGYGLTGLGTHFFLVWQVLNLTWLVVIFQLYPETQGRDREAIDGIFMRGLKAFVGCDREAREECKQVWPGKSFTCWRETMITYMGRQLEWARSFGLALEEMT